MASDVECRWREDEHQVQMNNWKELPDGAGQISVPTIEFNMIFQLIHIMRHFFHDGMGLRQLVDYYWLLSSGKIDIVKVKEMLEGYDCKCPVHVIPTGIDIAPFNKENFSKNILT